VLERNLKEYEILQLEAARLERDACKTLMENASLEQASKVFFHVYQIKALKSL
jgi:hypothetical protein